MKTNRSPPLQLPPLHLPPLHLPPLHLPPLHLPLRLNVDPLRLNLCPPRGDIELQCPPCPPCPPPLCGAAFTPDAINVIAANQLKNSMNFAFIGYLTSLDG